jgi:hypothetical protein
VIKGLYTALADVDETGENYALLVAMQDSLDQLSKSSSEASRLHDEIGFSPGQSGQCDGFRLSG